MKAFAKAAMAVASTKAFTEASTGVVGDAAEVTSTEAFTKASTSTKSFTEVLPGKLPRVRKLPRKHFHGFLGFSSMEASGSFHRRSEAQRLPRKLSRKPRKLRESFRSSFHEELEATSAEVYVLLPWKLPRLPRDLSGFHDSSRGYICTVHCWASSRSHPFFDNMVDAHCVRDEGGFTVQWLVRFIGLGLGLGYI